MYEGEEVGIRIVFEMEEIAHVREGMEGQTVHERKVVVVGGQIVYEEEGVGGCNKVSCHGNLLPRGHLWVGSEWHHLVRVYLMRHWQLCFQLVQFLVSCVHFDWSRQWAGQTLGDAQTVAPSSAF